MDILKLSDESKKHLVQLLDNEIEELQKKLKEHLDLRRQLGGDTTPKIKSKSNYSWRALSREVFRRVDELLQTDEVADRAIEIDPAKDDPDRSAVVSRVSASLSALATKGELGRIENPNTYGYLWGKREWFDDDEFPKEKYLNQLLERGIELKKTKKIKLMIRTKGKDTVDDNDLPF